MLIQGEQITVAYIMALRGDEDGIGARGHAAT